MSHNSVSWNNIHIVVRNIPGNRSRNHPTDIEPTKPTTPSLPHQAYHTKPTSPSLPHQAYLTKPTKATTPRMPISSLARLRSYQGYEGYEGHVGYYQEWQSRLSRLPRMIIKAMTAQRHRTTVRTRHRRRVRWCDCVVPVSKRARKGMAYSNPSPHQFVTIHWDPTPYHTISTGDSG